MSRAGFLAGSGFALPAMQIRLQVTESGWTLLFEGVCCAGSQRRVSPSIPPNTSEVEMFLDYLFQRMG